MTSRDSSIEPASSATASARSSTEHENKSTTSTEPVDNQPTEEDIRRKPWKYIGIKGYAKFIASDDDFFILRRFNTLNARVALGLQDEISELEEQLDVLDERYSDKNAEDVNNGTFRDDMEDRMEIIETLRRKLKRYNEFVIQQSALRKYPVAPRRDVKSIRNWHYNHDYQAISEEAQKYLEHEQDLICVASREKTPLRHVIDNSLRLRTLAFWRHREDNVPSYDTAYLSYYSDKRMDRFLSATIVVIGVAMLITPIWVLQSIELLRTKLIVITIFVSVFLLVVSSAMATKPFEALAATAGYAAVLMVFIQLDG